MRITTWAVRLLLALCAVGVVGGCATPEWARDWALVECFWCAGVRINLDGLSYWYVQGNRGFPHVYRNGTLPPWRFPDDIVESGCIEPGGGELSQRGQLAVAWRYRRVEVYDFKTGASLAQIPCRAVAVGWSNDGTRLVYLARPDGAPVDAQDFDVTLWSPAEGHLASWRVRFGSDVPPPWPWGVVNAFAISWDAHDRFFAVSTRSIPWTPWLWRTFVFDAERGLICECPYADAFFVGPGQLIACEKKKTLLGWHEREVLSLRIEGDALVKEKKLPGRMPVAASRPDEGVYLIWEKPPWFELWVPKGLTLGLRKVDSADCVRDRFFGEAKSLTLIRANLVPPLPCEPATRPRPR